MTDTFPLDSLTGYVTAYRRAKDKQHELEYEINMWREAVDTLGETIIRVLSEHDTSNVDSDKHTWFGHIDGKSVCRLVRYVDRRIDVKALREKEPELAEAFTRETLRTRLTLL